MDYLPVHFILLLTVFHFHIASSSLDEIVERISSAVSVNALLEKFSETGMCRGKLGRFPYSLIHSKTDPLSQGQSIAFAIIFFI